MQRPAMASQASGPPPQVLAPWTSSAGQKRIPCRAAAFERLGAVRQQAAPQGRPRRLPVALGTTDTTERLVVLWRDFRGGRALAERGSLEGPAWRSGGFPRRDHGRTILVRGLPESSLDMTRDLLVGGEPHAWPRLHVRHQPVEHRDPRSVADDVWVHRQDEHAALLVGAIEFRFPD
jgi:hypothetical protein